MFLRLTRIMGIASVAHLCDICCSQGSTLALPILYQHHQTPDFCTNAPNCPPGNRGSTPHDGSASRRESATRGSEPGKRTEKVRKPKNQMVRITSGAVPRLRLMSVRTNRGRRFRALRRFRSSRSCSSPPVSTAHELPGAPVMAKRDFWDGNPANGDRGSVARWSEYLVVQSRLSLRAGESV